MSVIGLVVWSPTAPTAGDAAVKTALETVGHTVTYIDDNDPAPTTGYDCFVILGSCSVANLGTKYDALAVGCVVLEVGLWVNMRMATENGESAGPSTDFINVHPTHPVTLGLASTISVITESKSQYSVAAASLTGNETTLATTGVGGKIIAWAYESGDALTSGLAPARRVAIGYNDSWPPVWTADGKALLLQAVVYASGDVNNGSASLIYDFTVTAAGSTTYKGSASPAYTFTVTASGQSTPTPPNIGGAATTYTFTVTANGTSAAVFTFSPPTQAESIPGHPLWSRYSIPVGQSVVRDDGVLTLMAYPWLGALAGLKEGTDFFYGGHEYEVSSATAVELIAAGFEVGGPTPPDPAPAFLPGVHFHAVWDRTGPAFGATHIDILTKLKAMNVGVVRIDTSWATWEPTQGAFSTDPYNGKLRESIQWCHDNGVQVLMTLNESPGWAVGEPGTPMLRRLPTSPSSLVGIADFVAEWLSTWGATIAGIEFWNEPDLTGFDDLGPRPDHYFDCLKVFYDTVQLSPHPTLPVVFGATEGANVSATPAPATNPRTHFITYCYDRKVELGMAYFPWDVMATHCYPGVDAATIPSTGTQYWRVRHFEYLESLMAARGDDSDVFMTEVGYSAHSNDEILGQGTQPPYQSGVTDVAQATLTAQAAQFVHDNYPRVRMVVVYNEWEKGDPATSGSYSDRHQFGFGILKFADRSTTKPIYSALQTTFGGIG